MKKLRNTLVLVLILLTSIAQSQRRIINVEEKIKHSSLIIKGQVIAKKNILRKNSDVRNSGQWFTLYLVKPLAVLKGDCDSSNTFQFLKLSGSYDSIENEVSLQPFKDGAVSPPQFGIYFLNGNAASLDENQSFPNAVFVGYLWGITCSGDKNDKTIKDLKDKYSLNYVPLIDTKETLKSMSAQGKTDSLKHVKSLDSLQRNKKAIEYYLQTINKAIMVHQKDADSVKREHTLAMLEQEKQKETLKLENINKALEAEQLKADSLWRKPPEDK